MRPRARGRSVTRCEIVDASYPHNLLDAVTGTPPAHRGLPCGLGRSARGPSNHRGEAGTKRSLRGNTEVRSTHRSSSAKPGSAIFYYGRSIVLPWSVKPDSVTQPTLDPRQAAQATCSLSRRRSPTFRTRLAVPAVGVLACVGTMAFVRPRTADARPTTAHGAASTARRVRNVGGFLEVTALNQDTPVSEHFRLRDFLTHDQAAVWPKYLVLREPLIDKLELVLSELRRMGVPANRLRVMSGFRTPQYNQQGVGAGGRVQDSHHQYGDAADVYVVNGDRDWMSDLNRDGRGPRARWGAL